MPEKSALSPAVREYLESINGAPCLLERFLLSSDFKKMQLLAKDFGGMDIVLPGKGDLLRLNVFGVITYVGTTGTIWAVGAPGAEEEMRGYSANIKDFLSAIRREVYPEADSAWCVEAVLQSIYDAISTRVQEAMTRSRRK